MVEYLKEQDMQNVVGEQHINEPLLADIRKEWHWVKPGIEEILAEQPQLTYKPEDVYAAVLMQQAVLWITPEGFVVSTQEQDQFNGDVTLLIWVAWAKKRGQNCAIKHYEFFASNDKEAGFKKIEVRSPVPAIEKYLITEGWQKDTVVYTREL